MRSFTCDYHPESYVETNLEGIMLQIKEDFGAQDIHLRIKCQDQRTLWLR